MKLKKKDVGSMSIDKLVAWAEDEANSPYLRSHPLKSRPFRKDFKGKVLFTKRSCNLENKAINDAAKILESMNDGVYGIIQYVDGMNDGVDSLNDVARVGQNMEVDNVEDINDVGNGVNINEEVLARQKKLDKGKRTMTEDDIVTIKKIMNVCRGNGISMRENDNHISSNNESDSEENVDEYADMYSESDSDESDKSFDYLSNGEDKVTELRKRKFEFKNTTDEANGQEGPTEAEQDTPNDVDKYADVDDNGIGLSPFVRQYEKYMEALLKKLKGNRIGITYPFAIRGEKFPTDKFKECLTYYALANGFSLWFERSTKNKVVAKCDQRKEIINDPSKGKHRAYKKFPSNNADKTLCNWRCYGRNFTDKIMMNPQITIDAIVDLVMKKYKCIVSRTQCRNAKTFALNEGDAAIQDHYGLPRVEFKGLFWAASKASYAQLFNKMMEKIRRANPKAHENLVKKEPNTWSRAFSNEGMCCEAMKNAKSSTIAVPELNAMRLKENHNYVRVHRSHRHEEDELHEIVDRKMDY
ncbi:hypothetical protein Tco_1248450 [Tanacetum coccineum]